MVHSTQEMKKPLNGNGNGNGHVIRELTKKAAKIQAVASPSAVKENQVTFQRANNSYLTGKPVRVTRHSVIFELYSPEITPQSSEVLTEFTVKLQDCSLYVGRAVVRSIVNTGTTVVCEVKLDESGWMNVQPITAGTYVRGNLTKEFKHFLADWQKFYKVLPEFKVVVADLQMILMDLRLWLDQVELEIGSQPLPTRSQMERLLLDDLRQPVLASVGKLLEKFELVAQQVNPDDRAAHIAFMQRQIHPFVLSAPFIHRTFYKPLGYAGDYEMVNMMVREPYAGNSLFAKMLNFIFLSTPPVEAHRDRLTYLTQMLQNETARSYALHKGRGVRIFNLGCGPAKEIQDFLAHHHVSNQARFELLDFNEETLAYTSQILNHGKREHQRNTGFKFIKKSVQQVLKEAAKLADHPEKFDIVYCAGLFDYLTDNVCAKLLELFYEMTAPGGLVMATNVADSNPSQNWMEYMLDWHLIYRNVSQFRALVPKKVRPDMVTVRAVGTGVNIVVEMRKPQHG
jgi:extracellular factor (EF) 3-hydroxypalmitic acid methyl ester biosynthesis protein